MQFSHVSQQAAGLRQCACHNSSCHNPICRNPICHNPSVSPRPRTRYISRCLARAAVPLLSLFAVAESFADTCIAPVAGGEYQLVFEDNFNGTELDRSKWNTEFLWGPGVIINNELQYYVNEDQFDYNPFKVSDGMLSIEAIKTPFRRDELYLTRSIYSATDAELLWRVPANAVSYQVYRDGVLLDTVTGGSYYDNTLEEGGDFAYEVVALDANDNVVLRGQTTVNTGDRAIPFPQMEFGLHLKPKVYGPNDGEIVWETPNRAGRYDIYRNGSLYRTLVGADFASLYESGLQRGTDYEYRVVAFDRCGEEIISGETVLNTSDPLSAANDLDPRLILSDTIYSKSTAELFWNQVAETAIYEVLLDGVVVQSSAARSYFVDGLVPGIDQPYVVNALDGDGNLVDTRRRTLNTADNSFALNRQPFLSGIITSYDAFRFLYGKVEMRARMPAGKGLWSAFWLLNAYYNEDQPADPEIDIIEAIGDQTTTANHAYHYNDSNGDYISAELRASMADFSQDFHTYTVEWSEERIVWSIDGVESRRIEGPQVSSEQMYILANLAVGGDFPGAPDESTVYPARFEIDYIRAWQRR